MADLYIEEYGELARDRSGNVSPVAGRAITVQKEAITASSTQSAAFQGGTHFIGIIADGDCHFAIGANPTATTSSMYIGTDQLVYREVNPGQKIALIQKS